MIPAQLIPVLITVDPLDRLVTLETCDRSDDETCPDQKTKTMKMSNTFRETFVTYETFDQTDEET